jgi:hypothetical protein
VPRAPPLCQAHDVASNAAARRPAVGRDDLLKVLAPPKEVLLPREVFLPKEVLLPKVFTILP